MPFDYSALSEIAINEVKDKGRDVTLQYVTAGTYDPATDDISGDSDTNATVRMLQLNYKKSEIDGTLIKSDDVMGLLANDSLTREPENGDKIIDNSVTFTIKNVKKVQPGDTILLYRLQLRG